MTCWVLERGIIVAVTTEGSMIVLMLGEDALALVLGEEELTLMQATTKTKGSIFAEKTKDRSLVETEAK
jgi:hypothetical protein